MWVIEVDILNSKKKPSTSITHVLIYKFFFERKVTSKAYV
jgi:hypothetical protein